MADNFNRAALTSPAVEPRKPGFGGLGALLMILVLIAAVVVAYKIVQSGAPIAAAAQQNRSMEKIQQQLNSIEGRLDRLERRRAVALKSSASAAEPQHGKAPGRAAPHGASESASSLSTDAPPQAPAPSGMPVQAKSDSLVASASLADSSSNDPGANRDAWQATANQLTDVVGVVGSQQAELSKTQAAVGRLTAESQRFAVPFQLHRGSRPQRVGPVALELKNSDVHRQRYSISVLLDDKPVEFKNRAVDELVDFILPGESAPVRFVATKIGHDSISGYMEVPSHSAPR